MNISASENPASETSIKVMLVDDSAVIRGALGRIIDECPDTHVAASIANGELAIEASRKHQPDVVILDIEMPVMDGLTALPKILEASPDTKVVMFSSLTESGADETLKAFSLGAVECIVKPSSAQGTNFEFQDKLLSMIKNLVPQPKAAKPQQNTATATAVATPPAEPITLRSGPTVYQAKPAILAIGSSTGGPQALFEVIKHFKDFDIPIVITQHMPATFTTILAQHITQQTGVEAFEAEQGMRVEAGKIYVAQGGLHMKILKDDNGLYTHLDDGPPEKFCKPSVEPMFRSVIDLFNGKVYGLILTGMGHDGIDSGKLLAEAGGKLLAQDEATSVVWGMPGAVARAGLCTDVLPLQEIGPHIRKAVLG